MLNGALQFINFFVLTLRSLVQLLLNLAHIVPERPRHIIIALVNIFDRGQALECAEVQDNIINILVELLLGFKGGNCEAVD